MRKRQGFVTEFDCHHSASCFIQLDPWVFEFQGRRIRQQEPSAIQVQVTISHGLRFFHVKCGHSVAKRHCRRPIVLSGFKIFVQATERKFKEAEQLYFGHPKMPQDRGFVNEFDRHHSTTSLALAVSNKGHSKALSF